MKDLLKLLSILGLVSLLNLTIGCGGAAEVGDDTPPDPEEPYDGGTNDASAETGTE